jgi:hypothetical protein
MYQHKPEPKFPSAVGDWSNICLHCDRPLVTEPGLDEWLHAENIAQRRAMAAWDAFQREQRAATGEAVEAAQ